MKLDLGDKHIKNGGKTKDVRIYLMEKNIENLMQALS
jgi:hypothetical protein